jgi:F-type H+-transporting ATPase subunit gamma
LLKLVRREQNESTTYATVGKKVRLQLEKTAESIKADFIVADPVAFSEVRPIAKFLTEQFLEGDFDKIKVCFTNFVSTLTQTPHVSQLLPIDASTLAEKQDYEGVGKENVKKTDHSSAISNDYEFEPSPEVVLDTLLPQYLNFQLYQMILEARASEHSARMVSMKAATDNAKNMIDDLTLDYNKLRQAAITAELLEITTAMKAME